MKEYLLSSNADNQRYDYFDKAIKSGEIKLEGNRIIYVNALGSIEQNYSDPEEKVRALVYSELLYHYEYNARIIHIELPIKLKPDVFADIAIFYPEDQNKLFAIIELKKETAGLPPI